MCKKILIIFKKITPVLVSVAALIVAYYSYVISENQLFVSTIGVEPHFYVDDVPLYDEKAQSWNEHELKIFNVGAPVANIRTTVNSFYLVDDLKEKGKKWIPIIGYYYASFRTGEPTGKITTHKGYNNADKDFRATQAIYRDQNDSYIFIELKHVVFISYRSFNGVSKQVCFMDTSLVDCSDVENLKEPSNYLKLDGLTYEKLIERYHETEKI